MKKYTQNINIINNNNLQRRVAFVMFWAFGLLALCYVMFLGNTIFNIVERKTLEIGALDLSNEVGNLELQYLSMSNNIDLAMANSMGFGETKIKNYETRTSLGSIKFNSNEL